MTAFHRMRFVWVCVRGGRGGKYSIPGCLYSRKEGARESHNLYCIVGNCCGCNFFFCNTGWI